MQPILFESSEIDFTSNGLGRIPCTSCIVTEERNGVYECEFTVAISEAIYPEITEGRIIACIHDDRKDLQPFDIYARSAPMNGLVTFRAHHVSYRLSKISVAPFTANDCAAAIAAIGTNSINTNPFTFWTDKTVIAAYKNTVPSTARSLLGGSEGSLLDVYGKGEYEWDKWTVKLHLNRGQDTDVVIRYGKNLLDIEQETDESESYNAVAPYWESTDGQVVTLAAGMVVDQAHVTDRINCIPLNLSDKWENPPTQQQLEDAATDYLNSSDSWKIKNNLKIDFVALWQTPEYQDVAGLERVGLCDKVSVVHPLLGVSANKIQIIKVEYDVLKERYCSMELGSPKATFADVIKGETTKSIMAVVPSTSVMQEAIEHASEMITGALGGNIVINRDANGKPIELLIMDTDNIATAVNVWRWNLGGLGHSSSGYAGPYTDIAITADGQINADLITTGVLRAIRIINGNNTFVVEADGSVTAHAINILGGSISISTTAETDDTIELLWEDDQTHTYRRLKMSPSYVYVSGFDTNDPNVNAMTFMGNGYLQLWYNNVVRGSLGSLGLFFYSAPNTLAASYTSTGINLYNAGISMYNGVGVRRLFMSFLGMSYYDTDGSTLLSEYLNSGITMHGANGQRYIFGRDGIVSYRSNNSPFFFVSDGALYVFDENNNTVFIISADPQTGDISIRSSVPFTPLANKVVNLGSESAPWQSIIGRSIELYGTSTVQTPFIDTHFAGSTSDYTGRIIEESAGAFRVYNTISWGSDERLKENITDLSEAEKRLIMSLKPRAFRFKESELRHAGLIAQEVIEAEEEHGIEDSCLVRGTGGEIPNPKHPEKTITDYYAVDYNSLTTLLLAQVQELTKTVEELKGKLAAMEGDLR